jgi:hypothetical protein
MWGRERRSEVEVKGLIPGYGLIFSVEGRWRGEEDGAKYRRESGNPVEIPPYVIYFRKETPHSNLSLY